MVIGTSSFLDPDTFCGPFAENLLVEGIWRKPLCRTQSTRLIESVGDEPYRYWGSPECPWRWLAARPLEPLRREQMHLRVTQQRVTKSLSMRRKSLTSVWRRSMSSTRKT